MSIWMARTGIWSITNGVALSSCWAVLLIAGVNTSVFAQAGLRESLERLDTNQNGEIEPDEITPLARPYLERIADTEARGIRLSLDRPMDIEDIQEAARIYHAIHNGVSDRRVRAEGQSNLESFGARDDQPLIPEFGLPRMKYLYTLDDREEAEETLERYDRNRDGYIDRGEAARSRWTHRNPFAMDLNKDGRLSMLELTQRYARRRLLDGTSDELVKRARRTEAASRSTSRESEQRGRSERWRSRGARYWLASNILERFDADRNGRLEGAETRNVGIPLGRMDADRDGEVTRDELQAFVQTLQDEAGNVIEGVPGWFYELDVDGDGQLALPEFVTDDWTRATAFQQLDSNGDGLLTSNEVLRSKDVMGGAYRNEDAQVLPPRRTVISEIEVEDSFVIADLDVRLSITHTYVDQLDAYLTGPEGQRVELFTEVGGSGDNFEETVFDDQAYRPITKSRAPFNGPHQPEALTRRQPSLSQFNGQNAQGVWQLIIRGTRSERFGMLHSWSLIARSQEELPQQAVETPELEAEPEDTP